MEIEWGDRDTLLFSTQSGLYRARLSANPPTAVLIAGSDNERGHRDSRGECRVQRSEVIKRSNSLSRNS